MAREVMGGLIEQIKGNLEGAAQPLIALYKQARTTPSARAEIAASAESASTLDCRFGVTEATIYKWKSRESGHARSHMVQRLQTTLTPAQEIIVAHLRRTLLLPLDDLLAVSREFLCEKVTRSGLDRCLRRHGVGLSSRRPRTSITRHSRATSPATRTWMSNTCHRYPMRPAGSVRGH